MEGIGKTSNDDEWLSGWEEIVEFKYLRSVLQKNGSFRENVNGKKWQVFCDLCDKRITIRLKDKLYKTVVRPVMMYVLKCWAIDRKI